MSDGSWRTAKAHDPALGRSEDPDQQPSTERDSHLNCFNPPARFENYSSE